MMASCAFLAVVGTLSFFTNPFQDYSRMSNGFQYDSRGNGQASIELSALDFGYAQGVYFDANHSNSDLLSERRVEAYMIVPNEDKWLLRRSFYDQWSYMTNIPPRLSVPVVRGKPMRLEFCRRMTGDGCTKSMFEQNETIAYQEDGERCWNLYLDWVLKNLSMGLGAWVVWDRQGISTPKGKPVLVTIEDIIYTPLACRGCFVACRGESGELSSDVGPMGRMIYYCHLYRQPQYIDFKGMIHAGKGMDKVCVYFQDGKSCDKDSKSRSMCVAGQVSLVADEASGPFELESKFRCLTGAHELTLEEQRKTVGTIALPLCRYTSPCREFRLHVQRSTGSEYGIDYYSGVLWMIRRKGCKEPIEVLKPYYLFDHSADQELHRRIWSCLVKIDNVLKRHKIGGEYSEGMCCARLFSQMSEDIMSVVVGSYEDRLICELFSLMKGKR